MADLIITPANVVCWNNATQPARKRQGLSGVAINAGDVVYEREDGDGIKRLYLADAGSTASALARGIAANSAPGVNQPVIYAYEGDIEPGATLTNGLTYHVSGNAGKMTSDINDIGATEYITGLGIAVDTRTLRIAINATGSLNN